MEVPYHVSPHHRAALLGQGLGSLEACLAYEGGETVKAAVEGRQTLRIDTEESGRYFMKRVRGRGFRDIANELRVLEHLHGAGVPVPEPVAFGLGNKSGVLITRALPADHTLEHVLVHENPDAARVERLLSRLAKLVRKLHEHGVNHRDLYVGHVMVDTSDGLYLLDLGRAETRTRVPLRRIVKDLAALHFSTPESRVGEEQRERFLRIYFGSEISSRSLERLGRAVDRKARRIRAHAERKIARGDANIHINE
jgi:heptose I phosphotransferase